MFRQFSVLDNMPSFILILTITLTLGLCLYAIYRVLTHVEHQEDRVGKLAELAGETNAALKVLMADKSRLSTLDPGLLDNIDGSLQLFSEQKPRWDENSVSSAELFKELLAADSSQLSDWRGSHQERIQELLATSELQRRELSKMEEMLAQAQTTIRRLRHTPQKQASESDQKTHALTAERARASRELDRVKNEMNSLQKKMQAEINEHSQANMIFMQEMQQLQKEKSELETRYKDLEKTHQRTLQEKNMIEEAFIRIDNHLETMSMAA